MLATKYQDIHNTYTKQAKIGISMAGKLFKTCQGF